MQEETRQCQNCKKDFTIEPDDFAFYETMKVPPPTWCPDCRMMRRFAWMGYGSLYKRKCDFTGEDVIIFYHPDSPYKIYRQDIWHSDKWDALSYGRDYDFNKSFFEQFRELQLSVPMPALHTAYSTMVQSEYCNAASELKNCYLCFFADRAENCGYCTAMSFLKECFDISWVNYCELSYDSVNLDHCYQAMYSQDCTNCQSIWFSKDLVGCSNCFGCIGLKNKNYYIFNQPYTKEEYQEKIKEFDIGSNKGVKDIKNRFEKFALQFPRRNFHGIKNVNSSGDYLYRCKNVKDSYWVDTAEDVRYSQHLQALNTAKAYDYTSFAYNAEWIYECSWVGINTRMMKFSFWNYGGHDGEYCIGCHGSGNIFGCVGVRDREYCILNKQYTKEEYYNLLGKIKKQMMEVPYIDARGNEYRYGEFFPSEFCPWAFNETRAYLFFPWSEADVIEKGFKWRDPDKREYQNTTTEVPDNIKDVQDSILNEVLKCSDCGKNYKLIKLELDFYRRMNVPVPKKCHFCRDRERHLRMNPMEIYTRKCAKCEKEIQTSYAPDRPEIVYCEQCYNNEVA